MLQDYLKPIWTNSRADQCKNITVCDETLYLVRIIRHTTKNNF